MSSRLIALLVWGLVAASAVFWVLRLSATPRPVPGAAVLATERVMAGGDLSPLLGAAAIVQADAAPPAPAAASRFRLTGVVATSQTVRQQASRSAPGVALISVDGAPPKAYRVGEVIESNLALHSVGLRSASLGDRAAAGGVAFVLVLPQPAEAATGRLSPGSSSTAGAPMPFASPPAGAPSVAMGPQGSATAASAPQQYPQMAPGFQVQGLPPGVQPPPGMQGADAQSRALRQ